jgi:hypothetical protein
LRFVKQPDSSGGSQNDWDAGVLGKENESRLGGWFAMIPYGGLLDPLSFM